MALDIADNDFVALSTAIQSGDSQAEAILYNRFSRGLVIMLQQSTSDPALAQDLMQETLLTVISNLRAGNVQQPEFLPRYIHQTAKYTLIGWYRKLSNQEIATDKYDHLAHEGDTEQLYVREQTRTWVRNLIGEMNIPRDRDILFRYYVKDQEKRQICEQLSLTPTHFDRVINRARNRFRTLAKARQDDE
ncbi:MAG: sigma-70 family RNA polymerase sigma factor [Pseudomonadales bacterium]|nr:sigma-70 family RNA polymerase sigma factor [Pseudomonadales bacterium]